MKLQGLKRNKELIKKLKEKKRLMFSFVKDSRSFYNELCPNCKRKVLVRTKRQVPLSENIYCKKCKAMAKEKFGGKYD